MKLPWKSDADADPTDATSATPTAPPTVKAHKVSASKDAASKDGASNSAAESDTAGKADGATTPGKGRPTPKRREAQTRRTGPVAPPPTTRAEARARKKAQQATLSKEERKELRAERSRKRNEQREKMMDGDEKFMIARDRGPVRAFVRDLVDSRRNFAGMFMPFAVLLIVGMMLSTIDPMIGVYLNFAMLAFVVLMVIDSVILGRSVNKRVRERFPETTDTGFRLGFYAFTRAMQLRMMRAPRPRLSVGDEV